MKNFFMIGDHEFLTTGIMSRSVRCLVDRSPDSSSFNVFLHPLRMSALGISENGFVRISASGKSAVASAKSSLTSPLSSVRMNRCFLLNLDVYFGQIVTLEPVPDLPAAEHVILEPIEDTAQGITGNLSDILAYARIDLTTLALEPNFVLPIFALNRVFEFQVKSVSPGTTVILRRKEVIQISNKLIPRPFRRRYDSISYDSLGGLTPQLNAIRFAIELPLLQPTIFRAFGLNFSKGLLVTGPEGCGKTLLGKAILEESPVYTESIQAASLLAQPTEDAAVILGKIASKAVTNAPSIVFIDDIDLIIPDQPVDDEVDCRLQFAVLSFVDRVLVRPNVVVIATARDASAIPARLRGVNRFAQHVEIQPPTRDQRVDIVRAMTRFLVVSEATIEEYVDRENAGNPGELRLMLDREIMAKLSEIIAETGAKGDALSVNQFRAIAIGEADAGAFAATEAFASSDAFGSPAGKKRPSIAQAGRPSGKGRLPSPINDPFGAAPPESDPFDGHGGQRDPFGGQAGSDPFGAAPAPQRKQNEGSDPFGAGPAPQRKQNEGSDPFGAGPSGPVRVPAGNDPFAVAAAPGGQARTPAGNDPFAAAPPGQGRAAAGPFGAAAALVGERKAAPAKQAGKSKGGGKSRKPDPFAPHK
jgi:AAA+ superfamily predicted ATPase